MTATVVDAGDGLPPTVPALLRARVAERPDAVLLACDDDVLTYGAADERSASLARGLLAAGAGKGTHVGILHPNGSEFVVSWLAAARIGAVSVPLSTFSTSAELATLLRNADVALLLSAAGYRSHDYVRSLAAAVPELDLTVPPPLLAPSAPVLRRIAFGSPRTATGTGPASTPAARPGAETDPANGHRRLTVTEPASGAAAPPAGSVLTGPAGATSPAGIAPATAPADTRSGTPPAGPTRASPAETHRANVDSWLAGVDSAWTVAGLSEGGSSVDEAVLRAAEDAVTPADRLVIVHTSGSTSEPKGVIHTHGALIRHLDNLNQIRHYTPDEVLFSNSPFFWIGGFAYGLLGTLLAGAELVCSNAADPAAVLDVIERERPTMVNGFAQSVAHLPNDPSFAGRDLSSIRRGNLYPIVPADVRPADPELRHQMLGMTEAGSVCLVSEDEGEQPEHRRGSFGRPAPGFEARVVDPDTGSACGPGAQGELHFRGPFLMEGYYGRPRHEAFDADGWYRTGDLVVVDDEGFFYFKGRRSEMIKTAGANVSPREVEAAILDVAGLTAHVVGLDDAERGQIVAAAVRVPDGRTVDVEVLRSGLRERLSAYKVPRRIVAVADADVPLMSSGKLDLPGLKDLLRDGE